MKSFLSAVQFLTILPMGGSRPFEAHRAVPFFPLVGLLLGTLLFVFDFLALTLWPRQAAAALDVVFLVIITGAFHLDGLADTADGLYAGRTRERALEVMKDSRVGVMGAVAILCVLALKWAGIASLNDHRIVLLAVIPAYARAGMMFGMRFLPYGRPGGGTGRIFFEKRMSLWAFSGILAPAALSLFLGWRGALLLNGVFVAAVAGIVLYYHRKMGCITGDMLGAMAEILEALLFVTVSAQWNFSG